MLRSLYISNYALISELNISFESGFSVITGETGAGKSIILGALSLIIGQRADTRSVKLDTEKCIIEACFDISAYAYLEKFFLENDLDFDCQSCVIRRELTAQGKSRAFVNDTPVALNIIKELSNHLIDIHSQHENLLLSNDNFQLEVVDSIAENASQLSGYNVNYENWKTSQDLLQQLKKDAERNSAEIDFLRFQWNELHSANLIEDEQDVLEQEQETLAHAEEIKTELFQCHSHLTDEQMALSTIKESATALSKIKDYVPNGLVWFERLQSASIELKDIANEINKYSENLEINPDRLLWVENRLSELFLLQKKYKTLTIAELIEKKNQLAEKLQRIDSFDEEIIRLQKRVDESFEKLQASSSILTESRKKACPAIEKYLVEQLSQLGMPNIQFEIHIIEKDEYSPKGKDEIQFWFTANKNHPPQPVAQVASGGEISRLMLCVKALIANKADLPTIIFDEIDSGVSGEVAYRMGVILQKLSKTMQVIAITHQPQIAAKGNHHYLVFKDESGHKTETHIKHLLPEERINELAQMMSGKQITNAAIQTAKELLKN